VSDVGPVAAVSEAGPVSDVGAAAALSDGAVRIVSDAGASVAGASDVGASDVGASDVGASEAGAAPAAPEAEAAPADCGAALALCVRARASAPIRPSVNARAANAVRVNLRMAITQHTAGQP
jgi:hypothetical protein